MWDVQGWIVRYFFNILHFWEKLLNFITYKFYLCWLLDRWNQFLWRINLRGWRRKGYKKDGTASCRRHPHRCGCHTLDPTTGTLPPHPVPPFILFFMLLSPPIHRGRIPLLHWPLELSYILLLSCLLLHWFCHSYV